MTTHCDPQHDLKVMAQTLEPMNAQEPIGVTKTPADLPEYWREHYEQRAAIREYEGGQFRDQAEAEALRETIEMMSAESQRTIPASSNEGIAHSIATHQGAFCPECGGMLVPESACRVCWCCGHSRCS